MHYLNKLVDKYRSWKEQRFFKKHKVTNWQEYDLKYDPDFNKDGYYLKKIFHGYKVVILVSSPTMIVKGFFGPFILCSPINDWCVENCKEKFRIQLMSLTELKKDEIVCNGVYGFEELVIAFKSVDDATLFLLTYNGPECKGNFDVVK